MLKQIASCAFSLSTLVGSAHAADTIKIAYIDPLSGAAAVTSELAFKHVQYLADKINAQGGVNGKKFELLPLDNKANPQESVVQAQKAVDQGAYFIIQGSSSSVAATLVGFANKNNERNPDKQILLLNYAAIDPSLTNDKCSFWHFRWDASSDIKLQAVTNYMKDKPDIKKVYLINQDYAHGQSVHVQARAMLKEKRPDIQIVGDEVHPLAKITDFAPYVAKIKASGADAVITGNWGQDMTLLLKAAADSGLQVNWYTMYAGSPGGPTAIKQANIADRVYTIVEGVPNAEPPEAQQTEQEFRARLANGLGFEYPRVYNEMLMLKRAIEEAKSEDVKAVAQKLEGMTIKTFMGADGYMRKDDHQFFQDMYVASFGPLPQGAKFDQENTGWGWRAQAIVKAKDTEVPTTCKMERPS